MDLHLVRDPGLKTTRVICMWAQAEGAESFNAAIREAYRLILDADAEDVKLGQSRLSMRRTPSMDKENPSVTTNPVASEDPDKAVRMKALFESLDDNHDGRLCRIDLLKAYGGRSGAAPNGVDPSVDERGTSELDDSDAAMGLEQIDDLLEILNTGPEIRVNGSRSLGQAEFGAWMLRSGFL